MKRMFALCLVFILALALTACGDKADPAPSGGSRNDDVLLYRQKRGRVHH